MKITFGVVDHSNSPVHKDKGVSWDKIKTTN